MTNTELKAALDAANARIAELESGATPAPALPTELAESVVHAVSESVEPWSYKARIGLTGYSGYDNNLPMRLMAAVKHAVRHERLGNAYEKLPTFDENAGFIVTVEFLPPKD